MRAVVTIFSLLLFSQSTFAKSGSRIENLAACLQAIDDANQEAAGKWLKENEGRELTEAERQKSQQERAEMATSQNVPMASGYAPATGARPKMNPIE